MGLSRVRLALVALALSLGTITIATCFYGMAKLAVDIVSVEVMVASK